MNKSQKTRSLLIVDDDSLDVEFLRRWWDYDRFNFQIADVEDGVEAMKYLRREGERRGALRPDMILLDLKMPKKDGHEVLAEIKSDKNLASIPVVIMTSSESTEDVQKCLEAGASAYLVKPVGWEAYARFFKALENLWLTHTNFIGSVAAKQNDNVFRR